MAPPNHAKRNAPSTITKKSVLGRYCVPQICDSWWKFASESRRLKIALSIDDDGGVICPIEFRQVSSACTS
jgi:hypothetical protein